MGGLSRSFNPFIAIRVALAAAASLAQSSFFSALRRGERQWISASPRLPGHVPTSWKQNLQAKGKSLNGARECARRLKQIERGHHGYARSS